MLSRNHMSIASRCARAFVLSAFVALTIAPYAAAADAQHDVTATPAVIDEKGKQRDILQETITLTNTSNSQQTLYPSVFNINPQAGQQGFTVAQDSQDLSASLANWIEVSRGTITLAPGETKSVPFIIRINENAISGTYHAVISFGKGDTRDEAESGTPIAYTTVNLEVQADIKEDMQLNKFTSDNVVFTGDDVLFNYQLQNIGNKDLQPTGDIRIYDRKGSEVATIDVNKEGKIVSADQTAQLASVWSAASGFGKYKAMLTVRFGSNQTAAVEDTVFFWVVPWKQIFGIVIGSLIAIIILAIYFQRWFEERHLGKLAAAGALKPGAFEHLTAPASELVPLPKVGEVAKELHKEVHEQVQQKKTAFSIFKRQGFAKAAAPAGSALPETPPLVQRSSAPQPAVMNGGTIDLKKMRPHAAAPIQVSTDGHVINLKRTT